MNDTSPAPATNVPNPHATPKVARWTGWVLTVLLGGLLLLSGVMKLAGGGPEMEEELARIGLSPSMIVPLAILEMTCVVIFLIPQTAVLGAILLTGYLGGAILTHWRVGDMFVMQAILGVLIWLAIYLRDRRLWALIPLR